MGYSLTIGEACIRHSEEGVDIDAEGVTLPDAPAFGEPTDNTNERWPSYSGWANFCRDVGLVDLMFNERNGGKGSFEWDGHERYPLMPSHPGSSPITKEHLAFAEDAIAKYREKHPDHIAQYAPPKQGAKPLFGNIYREEDTSDDPKFDGNLCRAEWLLFWMRWALANCKQPVFVNT